MYCRQAHGECEGVCTAIKPMVSTRVYVHVLLSAHGECEGVCTAVSPW